MTQRSSRPYAQYVWGLLLVVGMTAIFHALQGWISEDNLMLWFLVGVIAAALFWGEGPAVLVAFLSFLALDFGVFHPNFALSQPDLQYGLSLLTFLGVGFVISRLSMDLRRQAGAARWRARYSQALYEFGRELTTSPSREEVQRALREHAGRLWPGQLDSDEQGSLRWAGDAASGFEAFSQQAELALARLSSADEARQALLIAERERVQNALLNSLSHDLQTPLASLAGSLQVIRDPDLQLEPDVRQGLLQLAVEQTERLRRVVSDLLQITRLDGPGFRLNPQPVEVDELVGVVLEACPESLRQRIQPRVDAGVHEMEVSIDYVLVVNLLLNLLENAHKYSPEGTPIELHAWLDADSGEPDKKDTACVRFDVLDRGPGLPDDELPRIFDKFYRAQAQQHLSGSGLGLFIAKGVVDAHGGRIAASAREGGGLVLSCWLPTVAVVAEEAEEKSGDPS